MITAGALLVFAMTAGTWGATWLGQATWTERAPLLGIVAWHVLTLNVLVAVSYASLALAVGLPRISIDVAGFIDACVRNLQGAYATPVGALGSLSGISVLVALSCRLVWTAARTSARTHRERRRRARTVDLLGCHDLVPGVTILEHTTAYAFCVPGRHRRIVVTSATLSDLDHDQLQAVLAHEEAHLQGRHHLMLGLCRTLARAFPFVPAFRVAEIQVALLIELLADDAARRFVGAAPLGHALGALGRVSAPPATLAASASGVQGRLARLSLPPRPLRGPARLAALGAIALSVALTVAALAAPTIAAVNEGLCLIS